MKKLLLAGLLILSTSIMACDSLKTIREESEKTTKRFNKLIEKVQNSKDEETVYDIREQMGILSDKKLLELSHIRESHIQENGALDLIFKIADEQNNFFKYINKLDEVINKTLN